MSFKGKNILVLGAGISGMSVSLVLQEQGAYVTLNDAKAESLLNKDFSPLKQAGIRVVLGQQEEGLLNGIDYIVMSPGISIYIPLVEQAKARGIEVLSEVEVAYRLCKAPILAVTGTNGKTTTTSLLGDIMKAAGKNVVVGGNIGSALSKEVLKVDASGCVVAELSSFQLEAVSTFKPFIAAILNVTPDHIDRHRSFENYTLAKEQVFGKQGNEDYLVLNYEDPIVRNMADRAKSQVLFFSSLHEVSAGSYVDKGKIKINFQGKNVSICEVSELKLFGSHNVENVLAATIMAYISGVPVDTIAAVLKSFSGVEHRIEFVETVNGVSYYNDSKATNPESAIKALEAFKGNIILIAGGRDKMTDLSLFMERIKDKVDELILLGEAAERFQQAALKYNITNIHRVESFAEAVALANHISTIPQTVLLSPACSSYDMFNNYEERGKAFKALVRKLG